MAHAVVFFFDDDADAAVRELWRRLDLAGVPSLATMTHRRHRPHVTFAIAGTIGKAIRAALAAELRLLSLPALWLYTLGAFGRSLRAGPSSSSPTTENVLLLSAVVDAELLAVHSAVHDVLAGKVRQPSAYFLPGSWVPHCTLAQSMDDAELAAGFAVLHPVKPIRAAVRQVGVVDTHTGEVDMLLELNQR